MILLRNIRPLTDFKRNTASFRRRLRASGEPEVLTIDGKAELVVQDAAAYQRLLDALDEADAIRGIKAGLADAKAGRVRSLDGYERAFRRKRALPRRA